MRTYGGGGGIAPPLCTSALVGGEQGKDKSFTSTSLIKRYAMKTYGGIGCIDPRIVDLGGSWR
jgi:hypothetical protein